MKTLIAFLGSVISKVILETLENWKRNQAIKAEKTRKDQRNEQAIRDASRPDAS